MVLFQVYCACVLMLNKEFSYAIFYIQRTVHRDIFL